MQSGVLLTVDILVNVLKEVPPREDTCIRVYADDAGMVIPDISPHLPAIRGICDQCVAFAILAQDEK